MISYAFYLGCVGPLRYPDIENSIRLTLAELGVELLDMEGATCCPAPGAGFKNFDELAALTVSARNISIAEELGLDVMTFCGGCQGSLNWANKLLQSDPERKDRVNELLADMDREYKGTAKIKHLVEVMNEDVGVDHIREIAAGRLEGFKVAVHYGCHVLRPYKVEELDDPEMPRMLDDLVEAWGAESLEFTEKHTCCGAGGGLFANDRDLSLSIMRKKMVQIKELGGDMLVDICPFCHMQFDLGQMQLREKGEDFSIPVFYYNQVLALLMGFDRDQVAFIENTPRDKIIERILSTKMIEV
ncbi:MAG: CoB--CoM heterodisulfide reductase subunit B [Candidatus Syntrophoarchaeum sp.]|nr:CoB--CoM heterodisulfide reductase subunit B [Candidatus Syntrophoarchaeum sp.]